MFHVCLPEVLSKDIRLTVFIEKKGFDKKKSEEKYAEPAYRGYE
jgi:hypothetical protein